MPHRLRILLAEDEEVDFICAQRATAETPVVLRRVTDGEEALRYLRGEAHYADRTEFPEPHLLVLDLKMPRKNGFEVLDWVRSNARYRTTPVVILSTSGRKTDVDRSYLLGANTYFVKPMALAGFIELYQELVAYWRRATQLGDAH